MKLLDWPSPTLLTYFTPTTFAMFRSCALKGVLSNSSLYKELIYVQPKARLGAVCHEILERVGKGIFDQELFRQFCLVQYTAATQGVYQEQVSTPEQWPGYYIRLARLKLVGKKLWQDRNKTLGNLLNNP